MSDSIIAMKLNDTIKAGISSHTSVIIATMVCTAVVIFSIAGCTSIMVAPMKGVKGFNRIFLHENPKVGDYALYGNSDDTHRMKREIVDIREGIVEIRTTFPDTPGNISTLRFISFGSFVRKDGTVTEAWMLNTRNGQKTPLAISQPGDYNYVGEQSLMTLPVPETIATKAGTYSTDKVIVSTQRMNIPGANILTTSIWYFDSRVKFGLVRQHNISETDVTIVDVAAFINKISPVPQKYKSLSIYIIENSRHHTRTSKLDLIETN